MESNSSKKRQENVNMQQQLMDNINIIDQPDENLEYLKKPIGRAIFKSTYDDIENPGHGTRILNRKAEWAKERVICKICGVSYSKANKSVHEKSQKHLLYRKVTDKLYKGIVGDFNNVN